MGADEVSPIAAVLNFVWENFVQPNLERGATWGWKAAQWKRAADRYSQKLEQDYGKLFILGQPAPKPIDDIYTYVNVLERIRAFERYSEEELLETFISRGIQHQPEERQNGLSQVKTGENLFVLGKPGAGKTTFMKQVTISAARGKLTREVDDHLLSFLPKKYHETKTVTQLPVFISLRDHSESGRSLFESVEYELKICEFPEAAPFVDYLLQSGRALVLWDGLDEVKQDTGQRMRLIGEMHDFMRQYRGTQFLITCRVAATNFEFDNVRYLEMADFDDSQQRTFIHRWFDDNKDATNCWNELQKEDNKGLQELARIPLLLTLLVITYDETLTFPQRRVEIYEEAIDALLKSWDTKRRIKRGEEPYKELSLGRKRQMLSHISAEALMKGIFLFPKQKLARMIVHFMQRVPGLQESDIDGEIILQSIAERHGIFVEQAKGVYSFAHLSFQEYFTARYIANNTRQGTLEQLLHHILDDRWREVFLLSVSLLDDDVDDFFSMFSGFLTKMSKESIQLTRLLTWAKEKAEIVVFKRQPPYRLIVLRAWYLARVRFNTQTLSIDDLDFDFALGDSSDRALILNFIRKLDPAFALARTLNLALNRAISYAYDHDYARTALTVARATDHAYALIEYAQTHNLNNYTKYKNLYDTLKTLPMPDWEDDKEELWQLFTKSLSDVVAQFSDTSGFSYLMDISGSDEKEFDSMNWSETQREKYIVYLKSTVLLMDCLPLALISNRESIESRLLLPSELNFN